MQVKTTTARMLQHRLRLGGGGRGLGDVQGHLEADMFSPERADLKVL